MIFPCIEIANKILDIWDYYLAIEKLKYAKIIKENLNLTAYTKEEYDKTKKHNSDFSMSLLTNNGKKIVIVWKQNWDKIQNKKVFNRNPVEKLFNLEFVEWKSWTFIFSISLNWYSDFQKMQKLSGTFNILIFRDDKYCN